MNRKSSTRQSEIWVKNVFAKCYAVMQNKIENIACNNNECIYEREPILIIQSKEFQWKNEEDCEILAGILKRQQYGCSCLFTCDGVDFEALNRSGFFLYDAEMLFLASAVFCNMDAFYKFISFQSKEEKMLFIIERLLDVYGDEEYVAELISTGIQEEILSIVEFVIYGKRNEGQEIIAAWLLNMRKHLGLEDMPEFMYQFILPDIFSAVLGYETGTFFVFYEPNITKFDNLLPYALQDEFTKKMKEARDILASVFITGCGRLENIQSSQGFLAWGFLECLDESHSDIFIKFPYALFYFEAHYNRWESAAVMNSQKGNFEKVKYN